MLQDLFPCTDDPCNFDVYPGFPIQVPWYQGCENDMCASWLPEIYGIW